MATITSTQSGNFNATTTWVGGVVPVDADSFVIAAGHTVTYNVSTPVTNGFNDSDIYGILQTQLNTSTILRMNGRLRVRTNGTYHARAGHKLQFKGTAAESHIFYAVGETGSSVIMEGSDGMPVTTLSANANERSTSFAFTSAANFAVGEWFAIFNNSGAQVNSYSSPCVTLRDEGFWVHDISDNTVYFRQFVGPEATIVSAFGSNIIVSNSKVFRVGQIIIFGTGANRNVLTINYIDYRTNVLALSGSVTGTVAGLTVYETGSDKIHASGDKVRKCATVATTTSTSTDTTITVANANMFVAGDDIWIEARAEAGSNTDYYYTAYGNETPGPRYKHTISSVSGNTITLTAQIGYNVVSGALVNRLTRDVVVEPITPNTDYYGFHIESGGTSYSRAVILKDVYFKYCGSSYGQAEGGIYIREGNWKSNYLLPVTVTNTIPAHREQGWYEGITMTGSNSTRDWGGFWIRGRYDQLRCCHVQGRFNSSYGIYYREGQALYNSIAVGSEAWGPRLEGATEWGEIGYVYVSRCERGGRFQMYDSNVGHHHYITNATERAYSLVQSAYRGFYKHKNTGTRRGIEHDATAGPLVLIYSTLQYVSAYDYKTNSQLRGQYHAGHIDRGHGTSYVTILEHNMEYDAIHQSGYISQRDWDPVENAWRVYNIADGADYGSGWFETVFIPANTTARARVYLKLAPGYSGTYPLMEARDVISGVGPNLLANSGGYYSSYFAGGVQTNRFTSAAASAYEAKDITITAVPFPRHINIGVHQESSNQSEGWWLKDIVVMLDKPYANQKFAISNSDASGKPLITTGGSFDRRKMRLGGRLR
jgi:hypothetical protein